MVYTGIVQTVGTAWFNPTSWTLFVKAQPAGYWDKSNEGDSVAVNGVCLTLLKKPVGDEAEFFVMEETRKKTTFNCVLPSADLKGVDTAGINPPHPFEVNVEHSLRMGDSIGGHKVMGHIDGIGTITKIVVHADGSRDMWVDYNDIKPAFEDNVPIVYKGSICLAGVSLTVAELKDSQVRVSLIPHTLSHTILGKLAEGDKINVEFDHDMLLSDRHNTWVAPSDDEFMKRAVQCGDKGRITAPPNPWVGCVIVASDGVNVIGEGYHRKAGEPHAEINALQDAVARGYGSTIKGSTVYVTLEPCHHTGRTPPCDMELVKQGVGRVVIALLDPDKRVCGMGAQHLRDSGIAVVVGVGAELAHKSLEPYLHHRTTGIPYCLLKVALSLDAKIACADNTSQWITGSAARLHAHKLRSESQALIVGSRTAGVDQPQLTVRLPDVNAKPLRVVLDTRGVIHTGPLMDTSLAPTLIFHGPQVSKSVIDKWSKKGVESCCVATTPAPDVRLDLHAVMVELGRRGFLQVMVEGGAEVHSHFIKEKLVDEMVIYFGACILGSSAQPWARTEITKTIGDVEFMRLQDVEKFGNDVALIYKRANSPATVVKH